MAKKTKIMKSLFEFPTIPLCHSERSEESSLEKIFKQEGITVTNAKYLGRISHGYTRYRATLDVWEGKLVRGTLRDSDFEKPIWVNKRELERITFPSVYRKIAKQFYRNDSD